MICNITLYEDISIYSENIENLAKKLKEEDCDIEMIKFEINHYIEYIEETKKKIKMNEIIEKKQY